jgi:hypothetical protein
MAHTGMSTGVLVALEVVLAVGQPPIDLVVLALLVRVLLVVTV